MSGEPETAPEPTSAPTSNPLKAEEGGVPPAHDPMASGRYARFGPLRSTHQGPPLRLLDLLVVNAVFAGVGAAVAQNFGLTALLFVAPVALVANAITLAWSIRRRNVASICTNWGW